MGRGAGGAARRAVIVDRIVQAIPTPMLVNPERVAVKVACAIAGLTSLVAVQPGSLNVLLPAWAIYVWGSTWFLGGVSGLLGYWLPRRWLERAGHALIITGALEYAASVVAEIGPSGYVSVLLVLVVAYSSAIRLLVASRARHSRRRGRS